MASYKPVTAALRVLEVLAAVNRLNGVGTVRDIHHQTSIDKATIVRMLETLIAAGFVVRRQPGPTYGVTGKTLMLSASFDRHKVFGDILTPLLRDFRERIGWPSDVALFDGDAMLLIETSRAAGPLSFNRAPGYRAPVLGTSLGRSYIAHCPLEERLAFAKLMKSRDAPWNDVTQSTSTFEAAMSKVRECGYATMDAAYSHREYSGRISSIGVPIAHQDVIFASINVIYLKQALSPQRAIDEILPDLQNIAAQMGVELSQRMEERHIPSVSETLATLKA